MKGQSGCLLLDEEMVRQPGEGCAVWESVCIEGRHVQWKEACALQVSLCGGEGVHCPGLRRGDE